MAKRTRARKNRRFYYSALWHAVDFNCVHTVKMLLDTGENVNGQCGKYRKTVLHRAAEKGFTTVLKMLLENGADVKTRDIYGNTALHCATSSELAALELLQYKSVIDAKNSLGETPLHLAISAAVTYRMFNTREELIKLARNGDTFHVDSKYGLPGVVNLLLSQGASVNIKDNLGNTALHRGVCQEDIGIEHVKRNADINARNSYEKTPLHLARSSPPVKGLIARGVDVDAKNEGKETELFRAAKKHRMDILEIHLKAGADVNQVCGDHRQTVLHIAASSGFTEGVKLLLECGASVDKRDRFGNTPLHRGAWCQAVANELLKHNAVINARNAFGKTPFPFNSPDTLDGKKNPGLSWAKKKCKYVRGCKVEPRNFHVKGSSYCDIVKSSKMTSYLNIESSVSEMKNSQKEVRKTCTRIKLSNRKLKRPRNCDKPYQKRRKWKPRIKKVWIRDLDDVKSWGFDQETNSETWHQANERKKHKKEEESVSKKRLKHWIKKRPKSFYEPKDEREARRIYEDCYFN